MATTRVSDTGNLIYAGVEEVFSAAAQAQYPVDYKNIVREVPLQDLYGYYETMGDLGAARLHSEEADIMYHKIEWNNRTTITSRVYENGVKGSLESMHFDKYNIIESYFGKPLVQTMVNMKERVVAEIYNGVFSDTGADGVALAAATHPLKNDSSKYNDNIASGDMTPENVIDAKNHFNHIYDQAGEYFNTRPTHLLCHPDKLYLALMLLNSNLMALELTNTKNVLQDVMPVKVVTNKYLEGASAGVYPWFLLDKTLRAGCVLQTSKGLDLKSFWDWDTLTFKGLVYEIYGAGMTAPGYGFVASPGS